MGLLEGPDRASTSIVNFHGIGRPGRELEDGEESYWVERDEFFRVLDAVTDRPEIELTFDDGNESDISIALPALKERGLTATFYPLAGRLDASGSLTGSDVARLTREGMGIGSHGWRHQPWPTMSESDVALELVDAREALSEVSGIAIEDAALPMGQYNRKVLRQLRAAGYVSVVNSDRRNERRRGWLRPRFTFAARDTVHGLLAEMAAADSLRHRARTGLVGTAKRWRW